MIVGFVGEAGLEPTFCRFEGGGRFNDSRRVNGDVEVGFDANVLLSFRGLGLRSGRSLDSPADSLSASGGMIRVASNRAAANMPCSSRPSFRMSDTG